MGVGGQDFKEYKVKNRAETGKCSIFRGFEGKLPQFVPGWYEHFPFDHSDSKYLSPV